MKSFFLLTLSLLLMITLDAKKILICGVVKNADWAMHNTKKNMEELGSHFDDYAVIIYENNSTDYTATLYKSWANSNPKVNFISENIPDRPIGKTEAIALARNAVLDVAHRPQYKDFEYLVMADLDFTAPWPIDEIIKTIEGPQDWDAVTANGIRYGVYWDRYAFRNQQWPLGPETIGSSFWSALEKSKNWFNFYGDQWIRAYSAFGGLGIYKTKAILSASYSGVPTDDLRWYYAQILKSNAASITFQKKDGVVNHVPYATCCEHLTLYATMARKGHGRIFVNPEMKMFYYTEN